LPRWTAANIAVAQDPADNLKPAKDKSTVALIMAIGRALVAQEEPQPEYSMFFLKAKVPTRLAGHTTPGRRWMSSSPAG
jgi:hypothetical protein